MRPRRCKTREGRRSVAAHSRPASPSIASSRTCFIGSSLSTTTSRLTRNTSCGLGRADASARAECDRYCIVTRVIHTLVCLESPRPQRVSSHQLVHTCDLVGLPEMIFASPSFLAFVAPPNTCGTPTCPVPHCASVAAARTALRSFASSAARLHARRHATYRTAPAHPPSIGNLHPLSPTRRSSSPVPTSPAPPRRSAPTPRAPPPLRSRRDVGALGANPAPRHARAARLHQARQLRRRSTRPRSGGRAAASLPPSRSPRSGRRSAARPPSTLGRRSASSAVRSRGLTRQRARRPPRPRRRPR